MSAIAFYDSGRLLPYRHDLKQKQIEQRNVDAENTRKYIGYAGGAFANMAERTGTIFGARLGSASQQKDPTTGAMVDVPQKYGGGTTGAEYAKGDWQKGVMDDENHRRKVTHKLGLLTESVKYASIIRKREAWGDYDPVAGEVQYEKRWKQYLADVTGGAKSKTELMRTYRDLFSEDDHKIMEAANIQPDGEQKDELLKGLDKLTPYSRWLKYAEENKYYDPTVAGRSRPEVDLLMAFLKNEVKFPGMENAIATRDAEIEAAALKKEKDDAGESEIHEKFEKQFGNATEISEKTIEERQGWVGKLTNKETDSWLKKLTGNVSPVLGETIENLSETVTQHTPAGKKYKSLRERNKYSERGGVGQDQIIPPSNIPDLNVLEEKPEDIVAVQKHLAKQPITEVVSSFPTVNKEGKELTPWEGLMAWANRQKGTLKHKLRNNYHFFTGAMGEKNPFYEGNIGTDEKNAAANLLRDEARKKENQANLK